MTIPSSRSLIFEVKSKWKLRLRKTSDVFERLRTSSGIFGNDRVVFKNPSTPRIKISRLYRRKSWQVYESCFTGKVNAYSCERTMKEYVHGLFTTEVEINWTSDCTQMYFVESIRKNFVLTDWFGSYCNGGLHSPFTSRSGLRSVFWTLLSEMLR